MLIPNPKKLRGEDVLHLVLALSLLGSHHPYQGVRYAGNLKDPSIHSSLLIGAYQTEVFHDLLALGRYSRSPWRPCREIGGIAPSQCTEDVDWSSQSRDNGRVYSSGVLSEDFSYGGSVTAYLLDVETSGGGEEEGGEDEEEVIKMEDGDDFLGELPFGPPAREEEVIDESPLMKVEEDDWESVPIKVETSEEVNSWDDSDAEWGIDEVGGPLVEWSDVILKPEDDDDVLPPIDTQYVSDEEEALVLPEESPELFGSSSELSCEDMELIEVLWKQDVDLGVPFDLFNSTRAADGDTDTPQDEDELEKLKALAEKLNDCPKVDEETPEDFLGPWAGLPYTVDLETGEFVLQEDAEERPDSVVAVDPESILSSLGSSGQGEEVAKKDEEAPSDCLIPEYSLEEALQIVGLDEDEDDLSVEVASAEQVEGRADAKSVDLQEEDSNDLSDVISEMQASHYSHHHHQVVPHQQPHHHHLYAYHRNGVPQQQQQQGRAPLVRAVSMEQRWQDLANLLSLPQGGGVEGIPPHLQRSHNHQQHRNHYHGGAPLPASLLHNGFKEEVPTMNGVLINNATLAPPQGDLETGPSPYPSLLGGTPGGCSAASDLGSALATSMSLNGAGGDNVSGMGNGLEGMGMGFKTEPCTMPPTGPTPMHHHMQQHHHLPPNHHHIPNHSSAEFLFYQQQNSSSSGASSPSGGAPVTPTFPQPELHHGACSGVPPSADGLLSSILNEEDLQLMDMAVNEGMYTMRMLEGAAGGANISRGNISSSSSSGGPVDESSDSAVSSMGSDGGEWSEVPSGRSHQHYPVAPMGQNECHPGGKYRTYEFGFTPSVLPTHGFSASEMHGRRNRHDASHLGAGASDGPPVAQKKHHMFGRRYFQEQGPQPSSPESGISGGPPLRSNSPAGGALAPQSSGKYAFGETAGAASPDFPSGGAGAINSPSHPGLRHARHYSLVDPGHGPRPLHGESTGLIPGVRDGTTMHNHSYSLPPEGASAPRGPPARDKASSPRHRSLEPLSSERDLGPLSHISSDDSSRSCVEEVAPRRRSHHHLPHQQLSRDEKRARALGVPICVSDIINLPMDEFNERLSKHDLTEAQLGLIRDIRRRGKNKVAAQNCRKRKLDQILSLADEVRRMRERKEKLLRDRETMIEQHRIAKERFSRLYRHVFQALRDPEGRPYSQFEYSLQQSADGTVLLVPRAGGPPPDPQGGHGPGDAPGASGAGTPGRSGV